MGFWLRALSVVFVVLSVSFGTFVLLKGQGGQELTAQMARLRPSIDDFLSQGTKSVVAVVDEARRSAQPARPGMQPVDAELPSIVEDPRDIAAPAAPMPSVRASTSEAVSDLRLAQAPDREQLDLNPVEARLRAKVSQELLPYFDLFVYVSKATPDRGTWAQRMFVLAKREGNVYELLHNWPVSTGMEEVVESPSGRPLGTHTPEGVFKLDRWRAYEDYTSRQWKSPMPYAIFFDWRTEGRVSGLAIHGSDANGEKQLGRRASHGCIRLATDNARTLFQLITEKYRGRVPQFHVDPSTGTMSTRGVLLRDEAGRVKTSPGFKVLVFIEDYGGPSVDTVAALF